MNRKKKLPLLRTRNFILRLRFQTVLSNLFTPKDKRGFAMPKQIKKAEKSLEELLWDSANKLRGTVVSYDYIVARRLVLTETRGSFNFFYQ